MSQIILLILIILILITIFKNNFNESFQNEGNRRIPKVIYTYLIDNPPKIQIENIELLKSKTSNWNVIILTSKNINQFVDRFFLEKYRHFPEDKFVILLSYYIIIKNGGVWINPNITIYNGSYLNNYVNEYFFNDVDCILLQLKENKYNVYLKNFIVFATANSSFLKRLLKDLTKYFTIKYDDWKYKYFPKNYKIEEGDLDKTKLINYLTIRNLLTSGYYFNVKTRMEKNKKVYMVRLSEPSRKDFKNERILNYNIRNNLIII